jgi:hypothetical protein
MMYRQLVLVKVFVKNRKLREGHTPEDSPVSEVWQTFKVLAEPMTSGIIAVRGIEDRREE